MVVLSTTKKISKVELVVKWALSMNVQNKVHRVESKVLLKTDRLPPLPPLLQSAYVLHLALKNVTHENDRCALDVFFGSIVPCHWYPDAPFYSLSSFMRVKSVELG